MMFRKKKDPWLLGTLSDIKIGIVCTPSFGGNIKEEAEKRKLFVDDFFEQKQKKD